jgi:hypothetical protein
LHLLLTQDSAPSVSHARLDFDQSHPAFGTNDPAFILACGSVGKKFMTKLFWTICIALALSVPYAKAGSFDDGPDIDSEPCGYFCQLLSNAPLRAVRAQRVPPEIAPSAHRPMEMRKRASKSIGGKRSHLAVILVPLPRARPEYEPRPDQIQPPVLSPPPTTSAIVDAPPPNSNIIDPPPANPAPGAAPSTNDALKPTVTLDTAAQQASRLTSEAGRDNEPETTGSLRKDDPRVALVIAKDEVSSIAELAGKVVAIDSSLSQPEAIRTALVAAGAPEVQMSADQTRAIDRMLRNEVPAAILGLVSRDAAERIPKIDGYQIFRVPLSPG